MITREEIQRRFNIVGSSSELLETIDVVRQVAPTDLTVLLTGESGTGKEVFAQAIHTLSVRASKPLLVVNCGAIPEGLIESELFGHEKGAFTSAFETRKGYFETADGGTLFLDEIGEMPLATQVKLLRVLETGEFARVGSTVIKKTDVRIIAATNRNLEYEVQQKRFRADLYFRLRSLNIHLPPLRNRIEDIPLLAKSFAEEVASRNGIQLAGFDRDALEAMMRYTWPGNVRELRNVIESMVLLERGAQVTIAMVRKYLHGAEPDDGERNLPAISSKTVEQAERELIYRALLELNRNIQEVKEFLKKNGSNGKQSAEGPQLFEIDEPLTFEEMEQRLIQRALKRHKGNRRLAARELNISERTLYRKIRDLGLANL